MHLLLTTAMVLVAKKREIEVHSFTSSGEQYLSDTQKQKQLTGTFPVFSIISALSFTSFSSFLIFSFICCLAPPAICSILSILIW